MFKIIIIIVMLIVPTALLGQQLQPSAKDAIKVMPDDVIPILTHNNMLDMLDFMSAGQKAEVTNRLNGKTEMTLLSENCAAIKLSSTTRIDIHLMQRADNEMLIYMISTNEAEDSLRDSQVKVFNSKWQLAGEEFQFKNFHPQYFNEVKIDHQTKSLTMVETHRQLIFDGEPQGGNSVIVRTRHAEWDATKGVFIFKD